MESPVSKTQRFNQSSKTLLHIKLYAYYFTNSEFYISNFFMRDFRFIQVIQSAGKPLKSAFYNLITHIEVFICKV